MGIQTVMGEWAGVFDGSSAASLHTSKRGGFLGGWNHEMVAATLVGSQVPGDWLEQDHFQSPSLLPFPANMASR